MRALAVPVLVLIPVLVAAALLCGAEGAEAPANPVQARTATFAGVPPSRAQPGKRAEAARAAARRTLAFAPDAPVDGAEAAATDAAWRELPTERIVPGGIASAMVDEPERMFRWKGVNPEDVYIPPAARQRFLLLHEELQARQVELHNLEALTATEELGLLKRSRAGEFVDAADRARTKVLMSSAATAPGVAWKVFVEADGATFRIPMAELPNTTSVLQMAQAARREATRRRLQFFADLGTMPASNRQLLEQYVFSDGAAARLRALRVHDQARYVAVMRRLF